jgi:hypothetical protein
MNTPLPTLSLSLLLFSGAFGTLNAQTEAYTAAGDTVILYDDGTWEYQSDSKEDPSGLPPIDSLWYNPGKFDKPATAPQTVKDESGAFEVWYEDKKWQRTPSGRLNEDAKMAFKTKRPGGFGMVIYEPVELPLHVLREAALINARSADPNIQLTNQELRSVNGRKMLCLEMEGAVSGMKFKYFGYYYSNLSGSWQFITYTTQSLFDEFKPDFELLLNGLIIHKN